MCRMSWYKKSRYTPAVHSNNFTSCIHISLPEKGFLFYIFMFHSLFLLDDSLDGTSTGDGSHIGNCPTSQAYNCLSNGACNVCRPLSNKAEGCNIFSTTPVCDADSSTNGIQATYDTSKVAQCVACTKTGTHKLCRAIIFYFTSLSIGR